MLHTFFISKESKPWLLLYFKPKGRRQIITMYKMCLYVQSNALIIHPKPIITLKKWIKAHKNLKSRMSKKTFIFVMAFNFVAFEMLPCNRPIESGGKWDSLLKTCWNVPMQQTYKKWWTMKFTTMYVLKGLGLPHFAKWYLSQFVIIHNHSLESQ